MKISYLCKIEQQEDNRFFVTFPDFEEAITEGETLEEAIFNAEEALTLTLEGRIDEDLDIQAPKELKSVLPPLYEIYPSPRVQSALLIRFMREDKSMSQLARLLETSWPSAARLENPHHWITLRQLSKTAEVCDGKLILSFHPNSLFRAKGTQ